MKKLCFLHSIISLTMILIYSNGFSQYIQWERTFHDDRQQSVSTRTVTQTDDGGYIVAGAWGARFEDRRILSNWWIVKLTEDGDSLWGRIYGQDDIHETPYVVCQTADGGFVLMSSISSEDGRIRDPAILRIDENGDSLWSGRYGEDKDYLKDGLLTQEGNIVMLVTTDSWIDRTSMFMMNPEGELLWNADYGNDERLYLTRCMCETGNGFILAGHVYINVHPRGYDGLVIRTDNDGDTLWTRTYSNFGAHTEYFTDIVAANDGGFILCGSTWIDIDNVGQLPWLMKIDDEGQEIWRHLFNWNGGFGNIIELPDGNILISGGYTTENEDGYVNHAFLLTTDSEGDSLSIFDIEDDRDIFWHDIKLTDDGGLIGVLYPRTVAKLSLDENFVSEELKHYPGEAKLYPAYPNPFNTQARFVYSLPYSTSYSLYLYDHAGRFVRSMSSGYGSAGVHYGWLDAGALPSGSYYIRLLTPDGSITSPIVITK